MVVPVQNLAAHFHNTYDRAIHNIIIALSKGITVIDSSVAGIGGCPYAGKDATGNIATEDVLYLCKLLNIQTDVNLKSIIQIGDFISRKLNRKNESHVEEIDLNENLLNLRRKEI